MKDKNKVFKFSRLYGIKKLYKWHLDEIRKHASVKVLISLQGTGKTSSMMDDFTTQDEAIWVKQSRKKLKEDLKIISQKNDEAHIVYTLEDLCQTYLENHGTEDEPSELDLEVEQYRKLNIPPDRIHAFICSAEGCPYSERDKSLSGLSLVSFQNLKTRIDHLTQNSTLLGKPLVIYLDESDGLLSPTIHKFESFDVFSTLVNAEKKLLFASSYMNVSKFENAEGIREIFKTEFEQLIKTKELIAENRDRIREISNAIQVLSTNYFTEFNTEKMYVVSVPPIMTLFRYAIENPVKIIIGSAKLRHHIIERNKIIFFFQLMQSEVLDSVMFNPTLSDEFKVTKGSEIMLKQIEIVSSPTPFGRTTVYNLAVSKHSLSRNRYAIFDKSRTNLAPKEKELFDKRLDEAEKLIQKGLEYVLLTQSERFQNPMLVTYTGLVNHLQRLKKKFRGEKYGKWLSQTFNHYAYFSNAMHGMTASDRGYDSIVCFGDALDPQVVAFANNVLVAETGMKGFYVKPETDEQLKRIIYESMLAELLEAIHRSRGTVDNGIRIPVLTISNFLEPEDPVDKRIINEILTQDNIDIRSLNEDMKQVEKRKMYLELNETAKDMGLDF